MTLDEGHKILDEPKGPATKYLCSKFHNCNGHSVCKMAIFLFLQSFQQPIAPVAMTVSEGHSNWYGMKGLVTKYHCARFHDCSDHSV